MAAQSERPSWNGCLVEIFKQKPGKADPNAGRTNRSELLRQQRMAHESAQKTAGKWGDLSVGVIQRDKHVFIHYWPGNKIRSLSDLALKKPKEISDADHDALTRWLKSGRFEDFTQTLVAWNVNLEEAKRIAAELVETRRSNGEVIVNASPAVAS